MPSTSNNGRPVLQYLQEWNPFSLDPSLRSISTGVHAHSSVNVDEAKAVGDMILIPRNGTTPAEYTFQKKNQDTLGFTSSSVKIDEGRIQIDPLLLFQRLTTSCNHQMIWNELAFKHELCSYPPALIDSSLLLYEADKPALADAICKICESGVPADISDDGIQYILDGGGALLQCIPLSHSSTYGDTCNQYTEYAARKYKDAIVIFDGYENMNTEDMTHQRWSKGKAGATVTVAANMTTRMKKDQFLAY